MEKALSILWPVAAFGGLGVFVDFLIGRSGQDRARDFLLHWWVKFDDVRWSNFGEKEARFAVDVLDRWFGKRLFSWRRVAATLTIFTAVIAVGYGHVLMFLLTSAPPGLRLNLPGFHAAYFEPACNVLVGIFGLALSFSLTRAISVGVASLCTVRPSSNFLVFLSYLLATYLIVVLWLPFVTMARLLMAYSLMTLYPPEDLQIFPWSEVIREWFEGGLHDISWTPGNVISRLQSAWSLELEPFGLSLHPAWLYMTVSSYFASFLRLSISAVFLASFVLRPFVMRPVSLIWRRIVESDKPVFTLTFGGASAFATTLLQLGKHL